VSRIRGSRILFAAFVVLVIAGLYGAAGLRHPAAAAGAPRTPAVRVPVSSAVYACAAPGSAGTTAASLALAAVPASAGTGSVQVSQLVPAGSATTGPVLATVTQPGLLHVAAVRAAPALPKSLRAGQPGSSSKITTVAGRGGVLVTASGAMAQGLAAEQVSAGRPTAQCGAPGTSSWFMGPGQAAAGNIEVYLINTDSAPANAQVTAITDITKGGPLLDNADNGITVPPHSMVTQSLTGLLQSSKVLALQVSTSVGRVVAAVRESKTSTDDGSWLPVSQAPARSLVIAGIPHTSGSPKLFIAVPGGGTAAVKVTAVTQRGSYQPTGGTNIDLLGGTAYQIPLPSLGGVAGALKLTSSAPVIAAVELPGGPAGTSGVMAAAAAPVQEQGVLAGSPAGQGGTAEVVLSAPGKAATVRIAVGTTTTAASAQAGTVVQVKAGGSVLVPVHAPAGHHGVPLTVVVSPQPGSGPVYAGWTVSAGGKLQLVQPVPSSLTSVPLPAVRVVLSAIAP
jgi:Family of unknown function (DUF5719)